MEGTRAFASGPRTYDLEPHMARHSMQLREGPVGPVPDVPLLPLGAVGAVHMDLVAVMTAGPVPFLRSFSQIPFR